MGKLIGKIVLTGGPCAGKTTALSKIEQELSERGYRVFIVGESATELIKGGIRPFGDHPFDMVNFQRLILKYQKEKEKTYEDAIAMLPECEQCIILLDRGLMDNKAYITEEEFSTICREQEWKELDLLDSYDMVLHLVTAADGCPQYYTLENNQARSESVSEAIALDQKTQNAWLGHNRLVIIDNSTDFNEKLNRVLENIYQLVRIPYSIRYQRKFLVDLNHSDLTFLQNSNTIKIDLEQTYLLEEREHYERRLRRRTWNDEETFYLTLQKKAKDGLCKIVTDKKITQKEYLRLLELPIDGTIRKSRYTFVYKRQYFKLDVIEGEPFGILELNPISKDSKVSLPKCLKIEKEVTDESDFDNSVLARKKKKQKVLK